MGASHKKPSEDDSNLELYSLCWLHPSFQNTEEAIKAQNKLRLCINHFKIFENSDQCEDYVRSSNSYSRFIFIINDELARQIVPRIEQLRQVYSIYIHCLDIKNTQPWAQQYLKIKCVSDQIDAITTRIQSDYRIDDLFPVDIFDTKTTNFHFIYSQLLFDCLVRTNSNDKSRFITLCKNVYKDNENELNIIREFEQNYSANHSLLWYTRKSFIYRLLHKALLIQNIDLLFSLRFFIQDIYQQIREYKCLYSTRVYHSHLMTYDEIRLIQNSIGQFISINSFLSACLDRAVASFYIYEPNDLERVLFEIDADLQSSDVKVFGNVQWINSMEDNEQIIFMLGSIFRIENIFVNDDETWTIQMKYYSENSSELKPIFNMLTNEYNYGQERNLFSLGECLIRQGPLDEVEKYYQRLLNELSHNPDYIIQCYNTLGRLAKDKKDYDLSLQWLNKSIKTKTQNESNLVESYNNIAEIYQIKGHYKQALESYNKALTIFIKTFGDDHPKLAMCFNNIAIIYKREKKYTEALEYHQKALMILEKCRSDNDPDLAASHNNIGVIQRHLGHYDLAIEHYQKALEIYKRVLSCSYADIARTFRNIAIAYEDQGNLQEAVLNFKKSAIIYRQILPSDHPDLIEIEQKLRHASSHLK